MKRVGCGGAVPGWKGTVAAAILLGLTLTISPSGVLAQAAKETVKIGVIFPMTGTLADSGRYAVEAFKMAQEEINQAGGIAGLGGRPVEFVFADHQGKPELTTRETERLIQTNHVVAVTGSYTSATGLAGSAVAERLHVPWLQTVGLADSITERGLKFVFRNKPTGVCTLLRLSLYVVVFRFAPSDMLNDFPVRDGFDLHSVFQQAQKQLASVC